MPIWIYHLPPLGLALLMVGSILAVSLAGLVLARRYLIPHLQFHDGVNDAVSGTVQAIGVFYGITVGLIAVGVWNSYADATDLVAKEAASIAALYRDVSSLPAPLDATLPALLEDYTYDIIQNEWPAQQRGEFVAAGELLLDQFQRELTAFEPATPGQQVRYQEALHKYNDLVEHRRLRLNAVEGSLSGIMWGVIWVGAVISIGVAYLFNIEDFKLHALLVALMAGFLGIVLFMIVINDRPFAGVVSVGTEPYQLIVDTLLNASR